MSVAIIQQSKVGSLLQEYSDQVDDLKTSITILLYIYAIIILNYLLMKASDFDKMDDFYKTKHQGKKQEEKPQEPQKNDSLFKTNQFQPKQTSQNIFKNRHQNNTKEFKHQTITKWDTFEPRAFSRLSNRHKDEHFLQLFQDYIQMRGRLNAQLDKNRKLSTSKNHMQSEIALLKRKSPQKPIKGKRSEWTENEQLKEEIKRLHQKIIALTDNKKTNASIRPQSAATKKQKLIVPTTQDIKGQLQFQRKQVKELLIIIDELKATKYSLQAQLKEKQSLPVPRPNRNNTSAVVGNFSNQSQFQGVAHELERWKQKYNQLQLILDKMTEDKDKKIKQLEIQNLDLKESQRAKNTNINLTRVNQISTQFYQQKIDTLSRQNQKLQTQIRRLVQLPFNQNNDNKNQINLQNKNVQLQSALQKMKEDLNKTKQSSNKYLADLQFKNREGALLKGQNQKLKKQVKELIQKQTNTQSLNALETDINYDDYYRKLMGIVRLEGDDPVWRKFAAIATPSFESMSETQLKMQAQQLWKSKLQLLAHLEKAQVQLKTLQQSTQMRVGLYLKDKEKMQEELRQARARLDQWSSMDRVNAKREVQLYSWSGIKYDDSISVFDAEESELKDLENTYNYFDLYLGQLNLDQANITKNTNNRIKELSKIVTFLTVDFYNHDTQHSHFAQGNARKLDNNFSFRVQMNQMLVKFLTRQTLVLELWSPQGSTTVMLGKGQIWLRDLVSNASKDVSAVLRGKCPFYQMDRSLVGTVEYRIRMRLPIGSICQWANEDNKPNKIALDVLRLGQRKRLQIFIVRALGLPTTSSAFVYFNVQGEDYFTEAVRGSSPEWNFKKQVQMMMNEELEEEMKQSYFQFTILDDDKPVNEDVVGVAKADLTRMIDSVQRLDLDLEIKNKQFEAVGKLKVQFRWL